jgi:hypothetical protein
MLGEFRVDDPDKLLEYFYIDIIVESKGGKPFAFSIRNHDTPASKDEYRVHELFKIKRALPDHEVVFVSSYIDPPCREFLEKNGILCIELGVEILPKSGLYPRQDPQIPNRRHTTTLLEELSPLVGPQDFMLLECKATYDKKGLIKKLDMPFPRKKEYGDLTTWHVTQTKKTLEKALR